MPPTTEEVNKNDYKRNAASYYKAKTMANGTPAGARYTRYAESASNEP